MKRWATLALVLMLPFMTSASPAQEERPEHPDTEFQLGFCRAALRDAQSDLEKIAAELELIKLQLEAHRYTQEWLLGGLQKDLQRLSEIRDEWAEEARAIKERPKEKRK